MIAKAMPKNAKKRKTTPNWFKALVVVVLAILVGAIIGIPIAINIHPDENGNYSVEVKTEVIQDGKMKLSEEEKPAIVEEDGELVEKLLPTVEEIDGGQIIDEGTKEPTDDVKSAQGAIYRTDTWQDFIADTTDHCVIEGNIYGAQCVSLSQAFWTNYAGRSVSVCGTGAARGIWQCKDYNAGDDFITIINPSEIQAGDWIITNGGSYGHVAMAVGPYNYGYVAVYGENQGGVPCSEGGSKPNTINLSMKTFLGAFRPKSYIKKTEIVPALVPDTGIAR